MHLTTEQVNEYIRLYRERFESDISDKDALIQASALVQLVYAIACNKKEDYDEHKAPEVDK